MADNTPISVLQNLGGQVVSAAQNIPTAIQQAVTPTVQAASQIPQEVAGAAAKGVQVVSDTVYGAGKAAEPIINQLTHNPAIAAAIPPIAAVQAAVAVKEQAPAALKALSSIPNVTEAFRQQPVPTSAVQQQLPHPFISSIPQKETTEIVPSSGELPYIGKVWGVSNIISYISPQEKVISNVKELETPLKTETTLETPYKIGDTTYYPSTTTTSHGVTKTTTKISEPYSSPLDIFLRSNMPEPGTPEAKQTIDYTSKMVSLLPLIGLPARTISEETKFIDTLTSGKSKPYTSFIPFSEGYTEDIYSSTYKSPSASLVSASIPAVLGGFGTTLKIAGLGEGILAPTTTGGKLYQTVSTVTSAGLIGMYASYVSKRVFGFTPGELQQQFLPSISKEGNIESAKGFEGAKNLITSSYPGLEKSRQAINVVTTQELAPMILSAGVTSHIYDKLYGWAKTRYVPEIINPRSSGYQAEEGFPTSQYITTKDLESSFKTGTITLEKPELLGETIMAPSGVPITRIPTGTQIGAPEGKSYIYTGAEYPFLKSGYIGESKSELPAMFAAPQRISYFSKAGQSQAGGFGISSDILGLYKSPLAYRSVVKSGEYQTIPEELTSVKNPINPQTGKTWSTNDPYNPKNIAIGDWLRTEAKPGVPVIGQYGKAEWQFLIPSGSEVSSAKMTGWYKDAGVRIPQYDVTYTGKRSALYKAPTKLLNPLTGEEIIPIGKMYGSIGGYVSGKSIISSKQKMVPISFSSIKPYADITTQSDITSKKISTVLKTSGVSSKVSSIPDSDVSKWYSESSNISKSMSKSLDKYTSEISKSTDKLYTTSKITSDITSSKKTTDETTTGKTTTDITTTTDKIKTNMPLISLGGGGEHIIKGRKRKVHTEIFTLGKLVIPTGKVNVGYKADMRPLTTKQPTKRPVVKQSPLKIKAPATQIRYNKPQQKQSTRLHINVPTQPVRQVKARVVSTPRNYIPMMPKINPIRTNNNVPMNYIPINNLTGSKGKKKNNSTNLRSALF